MGSLGVKTIVVILFLSWILLSLVVGACLFFDEYYKLDAVKNLNNFIRPEFKYNIKPEALERQIFVLGALILPFFALLLMRTTSKAENSASFITMTGADWLRL